MTIVSRGAMGRVHTLEAALKRVPRRYGPFGVVMGSAWLWALNLSRHNFNIDRQYPPQEYINGEERTKKHIKRPSQAT